MDYQALTPELVQELSAIAPGRVFTGSDINEDYSHDEMPIYGKSVPEAVVEAASTEEIAAVMKFCNEHHIPLPPAAPVRAWWAVRCPSAAACCW